MRIRQNLAGVALVVTLCHLKLDWCVKAVTSVPRFIERNVDPTFSGRYQEFANCLNCPETSGVNENILYFDLSGVVT